MKAEKSAQLRQSRWIRHEYAWERTRETRLLCPRWRHQGWSTLANDSFSFSPNMGYQELSREIKVLRGAITRGSLFIFRRNLPFFKPDFCQIMKFGRSKKTFFHSPPHFFATKKGGDEWRTEGKIPIRESRDFFLSGFFSFLPRIKKEDLKELTSQLEYSYFPFFLAKKEGVQMNNTREEQCRGISFYSCFVSGRFPTGKVGLPSLFCLQGPAKVTFFDLLCIFERAEVRFV